MPRTLFADGTCLCSIAWAVGWLIQVLPVAPLAAEPPKAPLTREQQEKLKERDRHVREANQLSKKGELADAIATVEKALALERQVFGEMHEDVAESLEWLAALHQQRDDFAAARRVRRSALATRLHLHGDKDWRVTDARLALADVDLLEKLSREQRQRLRSAVQLNRRAEDLGDKSKYDEALRLAQQSLQIRKELLGEGHRLTAASLHKIGWLYRGKGDYTRAEPIYLQALTLRKRLLGEDHPSYAVTLNHLGWLCTYRKEYERAEKLFRQAAEIHRRAEGDTSSPYRTSLDNLLQLYARMARQYEDAEDYADALRVRREELAIRTQLHGEKHWRVTNARLALADVERLSRMTPPQRKEIMDAERMNREARTLRRQRRFGEAVKLAHQALEIRGQVLGEKHSDYADSLSTLAGLYKDMKEYAKAKPLYQKALAIQKRNLGEKHPDYAKSLNNLGTLYHAGGDYAKAEPLYLQALEIYKQTRGERHPANADTLYNLAELYKDSEDYDKAEPLYRQALALEKEALGEKDPDYVASVAGLAEFYAVMAEKLPASGDFAGGRRAAHEALTLRIKLHGATHWKTTDARLALADVDFLEKLDPEQRRQVNEAVSLLRRVNELQREGKGREALPLAEKALRIRQNVYGLQHHRCADALTWVGFLRKSQDDYAKAESFYRQALEIDKKVRGEKHPGCAVNLSNLATLHYYLGNYTKAEPLYLQALEIKKEALGEKSPEYATDLNNLATLYRSMGAYAKAEPLSRQAVEIKRQTLGEKDPSYAISLNNLALLYQDTGDYAKAEPLYRRSLEITKQSLGEKHPDYATSLNNLATLYKVTGDYAKAEPLFRQTVEIVKRTRGEKHSDYASSLNNLAELYKELGDYVRAEPLYRKALEIKKQALGEDHVEYARNLNNLAALYLATGDYAKAEPFLRKALVIVKQSLREKHPDYATSLNNLAELYKAMKEYAKAESLYRQATEITRQSLGEKHPDYATSLNNLAGLYTIRGEFAKAEPLFQEVLAIRGRTLGENHAAYADSLNNLASLYWAMGAFHKAEPLHRQALDLLKKTLGEKHPGYAVSLGNLAQLYWSEAARLQLLPPQPDPLYNLAVLYACQVDYTHAERLSRQALSLSHAILDLTAAVQSERQQLEMLQRLRPLLDEYLSLANLVRQPVEEQYRHVLTWKGVVSRRQHQQRLARNQPDLAGDFAKLDGVTAHLAALALAVPLPSKQETRHRKIQELTEEKERLEIHLARRSAAFRKEQKRHHLEPAQLQAVLPPEVVLIDFLEYGHKRPSEQDHWKSERWLMAFVVRRDSLVRVDLGPVSRIEEALGRWRLALQRRFRIRSDDDLGAAVRQLIWAPLEQHLRGARVVLVSPDGDLARVPFAALPGGKKDSYLLEEWSLAVVPVPQFLPELLTPRPGADTDKPSLLLIGDVRYDGAVGGGETIAESRMAARGSADALFRWPALANTRAEVTAIANAFPRRSEKGAVTQLHQAEATEAAVRRQAPAHRYLHFATHGYFAPKELHSVLRAVSRGKETDVGSLFRGKGGVAGFHPGILSGLVLAGANRPVDAMKDDGILTAMEVEGLDLIGVELATLSACETGLGEQAGGEGLLGLQRAFQVAGARSAVAGLWQVDDAATRQLMVLFYDNLWRKKLPKLEALRQAQLWMLKEGDGWMRKEGISRGMIDVRVPRERLPKEDGRLPPYYWAAFALSGDWR